MLCCVQENLWKWKWGWASERGRACLELSMCEREYRKWERVTKSLFACIPPTLSLLSPTLVIPCWEPPRPDPEERPRRRVVGWKLCFRVVFVISKRPLYTSSRVIKDSREVRTSPSIGEATANARIMRVTELCRRENLVDAGKSWVFLKECTCKKLGGVYVQKVCLSLTGPISKSSHSFEDFERFCMLRRSIRSHIFW